LIARRIYFIYIYLDYPFKSLSRSISNKRSLRIPIILGFLFFLFHSGFAQANSASFIINQLPIDVAKSTTTSIEILNESYELERFKIYFRQSYTTTSGQSLRTWYGQSLKDSGRVIHISNSQKKVDIYIASSSTSYRLDAAGKSYSWRESSHILKANSGCKLLGSTTHSKKIRKIIAASDLIIYDVALTATPQFSAIHGNTTTEVLMSLMGYLNQINTIYERELGIRLKLVQGSEKLVFLDGQGDPFSNQIGSAVLQNIQILKDSIGIPNYDIGHLLRGEGGGLANIEVACTVNKGFGVSGFENAATFHLLLAHEIGHQIGAGHTWNSCSSTLNNLQRSPSSAMEPGSGSSIMSYAGLCGANNIASERESYFHAISIEQIRTYTRLNAGATCPQIITESNSPPVVIQLTSTEKAIPKSTPFILSGNAFDSEEDILTHAWDQIDQDKAVNLGVQTLFNPIIRSRSPSITNQRFIPDLVNLANGIDDQTELLPTMNRAMEFRYIVRDNHPGNGNLDWADFTLLTDSTAGPFKLIENPSNMWFANGIHPVEWEVANTDNAIVDCQLVDILIDYDGLLEFKDTLAHRIPNDGLHYITLPDSVASNARLMIKAVDNIFFDISDAPFQVNRIAQADFQIYTDTTSRTICDETDIRFAIRSIGLNGFMNPIRYTLASPIEGLSATFMENDQLPGMDVQVHINLANTLERKDIVIPIDAFAANGTTQRLNFTLRLLKKDLTIPILQNPMDGQVLDMTSQEFLWSSDPKTSKNIIEIANSPTFAPSNILFQDSTSLDNISTVLSSNENYYWRIKSFSSCSSSSSSGTQAFGIKSTTCSSLSNAIHQTISVGIDSISSPINVTIDKPIQSIVLSNIKGTHSYIGDLTFVLIAPDGRRLELVKNECNESRDFDFGIADASDRLRCSIDRGLSYRAIDNLGDLQGIGSKGDWVLRIIDNVPGDGGVLEGWGLTICWFDNPSNPTIITSDTLTLQPGKSATINGSILQAQDGDNNTSEIRFIIINETTNGLIINGTDTLRVGDSFLQADIDNGVVQYIHTNNVTEMDHLNYVVTDGQGAISSIMTMNIAIRTNVNIISIQEAFGITLYPNPASQVLNILLPPYNHSDINIQLFHINGKVVAQKTIGKFQSTNQLDLAAVPDGIYVLKLIAGGVTGSQRIIIQR